MSFADAKAHWQGTRRAARIAERQAEAQRPLSFEEQLARVAAGKVGLTRAIVRCHLEPRVAAS